MLGVINTPPCEQCLQTSVGYTRSTPNPVAPSLDRGNMAYPCVVTPKAIQRK